MPNRDYDMSVDCTASINDFLCQQYQLEEYPYVAEARQQTIAAFRHSLTQNACVHSSIGSIVPNSVGYWEPAGLEALGS